MAPVETHLAPPRLAWRKSSRSNGGEGGCVEVAAWRKSGRSSSSGACVEVAPVEHVVAVRDSKDPDGPKLTFRRADWRHLLSQIKAAAYDL